jgi:hypothetical protein
MIKLVSIENSNSMVYFIVYIYLKIFPFIFYNFTIEGDTKNLITWDIQWFLELPIYCR